MKFKNIFKKKKSLDYSYPYPISDYQKGMVSNLVGWNGDKFPGSYGFNKIIEACDYWTLRKRSYELFTQNMYAKGIIKRILHNEIFTGLTVSPNPIGDIIWPKLSEAERMDNAVKFGDLISTKFKLYADNYELFDYKQQLTFGEFQSQVRLEAMLSGDGIVVCRINPKSNLPCWEWINGNYIRTPMVEYSLPEGHVIKNGVELDKEGRHIAYYVQSVKGDAISSERIPVIGEKSHRRIAWMVYGSEKMADEVRGQPLLACILSMLKDLDRYRDSEVRAAVVNAMIAFTVERDSSSPIGSRPTAGLARVQREVGPEEIEAGGAAVPKMGTGRQPISVMNPGTVFDDLAPGEHVSSFATNRPNVNYKAFEEAILNGISWALEIPPEIVSLKFTSSYSASRQANNEFEVYLKLRVAKNATDFCQIIYEEFVIQSVLNGKLVLPGFLNAFIYPSLWETKAAWLSASWSGINRPSVDRNKDVKAAHDALNDGLTTFDDECRRLNGKGFREVAAQLKRELDYFKSLGVTPGILENNNGEPAYPDNIADSDTGDDDFDDDKKEE